MADVIQVFTDKIYLDNVGYAAQVVGRPTGHIWEGWIEFVSEDGEDVRRTRRETTQPDREALEYWATGLSVTYLEGALARTLEPQSVVAAVPVAPFFDGPAPNPAPAPARVAPDRAVLDPFSVGAKGEDLLRRELGALGGRHLRNIVRAYELADESLDLEALSEPELIEIIVSRVMLT